jgi:hypothetical protein
MAATISLPVGLTASYRNVARTERAGSMIRPSFHVQDCHVPPTVLDQRAVALTSADGGLSPTLFTAVMR